MYLELVNRYKNQYRFRLYAYSLLPERLHLLVEPGDDATISQIMHDLNSAYTKYFNGKNGRRGHLFESRFKSSLVEKAKYLADATRYVHRQAPEGALSSLEIYVLQEEGSVSPAPLDMQAEVREALEFLKNRNNTAKYKKFVLDAPEAGAEDLEKSFKRASVIGSAEFVERVQNRIKEHAEIRKEEQAAAAKPNRMVLFVLGGAMLLTTSTSIYFYVSRQKVEAHYEAMIEKMENETSSKVLSDEPASQTPEGGLQGEAS